MSHVHLDVLSIDAAPLGPRNPLPPLAGAPDAHAETRAGDADGEMRRNMAYGRERTTLPYLQQDGYGRDRVASRLRTAVVENEVLRAVFLLDHGGRLWSLTHKPSGRELLYRNEVLQPANLALRNAWFAGGVEWNIGTIGHSPLTCEPLHAVRVERPDGTPVLRMYEFERMRQLVFQIDACLPAGSEMLMVHVRVVNPNDAEVPMYWWSNTAVPESDDVRVVVPADHAWHFSYDRTVRRVPMPEYQGSDRSYSTRGASAADYFFDLPGHERRWIAALDGSGRGLVQTSTQRLRGRKLFVWGTGPGSEHWQTWLSPKGGSYLEIQAGLARTQLEHLPMPPKASWSWTEAYGLLEADPALIHGADWNLARRAAADGLERLLPRAVVAAETDAAGEWADAAPVETLHRASGWGALERRLRSSRGDDSLVLTGTPFGDETMGVEQEPWLLLLETGRMAGFSALGGPSDERPAPAAAPASYQVHPRWRELLDGAEDWLGLLHLGVAHLHAGNGDAARRAWLRSVEVRPSAWALRNLAVLDREEGALDAAAEGYRRAMELAPDVLPLAVEAAGALVDMGKAADALGLIASLPAAFRAAGRVRLAQARAALSLGDLPRVRALLESGIDVPDIREGESSLDELWFAYQERRIAAEEGTPIDSSLRERVVRDFPVPLVYEFRMGTA